MVVKGVKQDIIPYEGSWYLSMFLLGDGSLTSYVHSLLDGPGKGM